MHHVIKVLIYGAGGHGRVAADLLQSDPRYQPVGIISDHPFKRSYSFLGLTVVGTGEQLMANEISIPFDQVMVAIGDCQIRKQISEALIRAGITLCGYVHPQTIISATAHIDPTAMIWPGAIIQAETKVGPGVIVNTGAVIEHDCDIKAYAHLAPRAIICADVTVGECTWVGAGTTIIQQLTLGKNCMIGAGSVVVEDLFDDTFGYGVPFRQRTKADSGRLLV